MTQPEALSRYWDDVLDDRPTDANPASVDPSLAETITRLQGLAPAEPPSHVRDRVWKRVMETDSAVSPDPGTSLHPLPDADPSRHFVPNGLRHTRLEDDTMIQATPLFPDSPLSRQTMSPEPAPAVLGRPMWPRRHGMPAHGAIGATLATAALVVLMLGTMLVLVRPGWVPAPPFQPMTAFVPAVSNAGQLEFLWRVIGRTLGDASPLPAGSYPGANGVDIALLSLPSGIGVDATGNIWVADGDLDQFQVFDDNGDFLSVWGTAGAGNGELQFFSTNSGSGGAYGDVAFDSAGNIYVADTGNTRIQKFSSSSEFMFAWGTEGSDDGQFITPSGIAVGPDDVVYVVDEGRDDVQAFSSDGTFLRAMGGPGRGDGQFDLASGIAVDSDGGVWVSDWGNNRIQHFDAAGEWIASWGEVGDEEGEIDNPVGVAVDGQNRVYVADQDNTRVQVFSEDGQFLSAIGHNGIDPGEFSWMTGIAAGPDNTVYVIDSDQHSIQAFQMQEP